MRTRGVILWAAVFAVATSATWLFAAPSDRWGGRLARPQAEGLTDDATRGCTTTAGETPAPPKTPAAKQPAHDTTARTRFATITVTLNPGGVALAAYQFEITADHSFTVVGLDNAGHPSFSDPPRYDRAAAAEGTDRLIVADYSTLPAGQLLAKPQAAATIHAAFTVDAGTTDRQLAESIELTLTAAADAAGNRIDADITYDLHLAERPGQE